jgi:hypothetical protein
MDTVFTAYLCFMGFLALVTLWISIEMCFDVGDYDNQFPVANAIWQGVRKLARFH